MIEPIEERKRIVKELNEKFKPIRVNLVYKDNSFEVVWAFPSSKKDEEIYELEHLEVPMKFRLLNQPLGWAGAKWGMEILAYTKIKDMPPAAYEQENYDRYLEEYEKQNANSY
jgi:hypothetical protein